MNEDQPLPIRRREPAGTIDDIAAEWVARLDRGLNDAERAELELWLSDDTRHQGALARAKAIWLHADRAASLGQAVAEPVAGPVPKQDGRTARTSRRSILIGGSALAASLVAGAIAVPLMRHHGQRFASNVGEIRRVPLGDGSVATLDTDSVIETLFSSTARTVRLVSGMAFFEVANDASRPFLVQVRDVTVRVIGAAFSVRALAGIPVAVMVSHGRVAISRTESGGRTLDVAADMRAILPDTTPADAPIGTVAPVEPDALQRALAWRDGMLAFEGETLADAVARFRRYGGPSIAVESPALARQTISGLFAASNPRGFARAVAVSLDARVREDGNTIHLMESLPQ